MMRNYLNKLLLLCAVYISFISISFAQGPGNISVDQLDKQKQTSLGLYVTAKEAYEKWQADPDKVKILDVRTPEEYIFVGHAEMAWNIPLLYLTYQWDTEKGFFVTKSNPDFISLVNELFTPEDTILIICRSGKRSARAANLLAQNGYKNVYNIIDGMEGDTVKDPESLFMGKRMKNGWKNAGLPWTHDLDPDLVWHPR